MLLGFCALPCYKFLRHDVSGTLFSAHVSLPTASLHISSFIKRSGANAKSVVLTLLPRHTSLVSYDALGSLLSNVEHFHKTCLLIPLDPGKGQILWTEKMIQDPSINDF